MAEGLSNKHPLKLIVGNSVPALGAQVAHLLETTVADALLTQFADGETQVQVKESVRDADCFVLQSTCCPINDNLMELLIIIDALHRASAHRINVVTPYFGYARQDKKVQPREPITARLVANLLERAGADALMAIDLHSQSIPGFFDIPVDHLTATILLAEDISAAGLAGEDCIVVSPDAGGVGRAKYVADRVGRPLAIIHKRRDEPNQSEAMELVGDVRGRRAVIVDDMVDTAGSICRGGALLKKRGATVVYVYATHGIFSQDAFERLAGSSIEEVVVTDTIPLRCDPEVACVRTVSVGKLLADAIRCNHQGKSVHGLFK